jgi:DNA-binding transcriptional LysR family regulator
LQDKVGLVSPELRHLRYFIAVAEELSFTRAAERLHVVQQALSTAVQQLERELGVQLFVRTTRKVELTDAGRRLLEEARPALSAVEHAWESAQQAQSEAELSLRVGYTSSVGYCAVPALHSAALERLPDVRVTWWQVWNADIPGDVAAGRYDAGLTRYPDRRSELQYERIAEEALGVIVNSAHAVARADRVDWDDLSRETWLMFPREIAPAAHEEIVALLRNNVDEPQLVTSPDAGDDGLILRYFESGEAITLAPVSMANAMVARSRGGIVFVPLVEPVPTLPLDIFWDRRGQTGAIEAFIRLARELGAAGRLVDSVAARVD